MSANAISQEVLDVRKLLRSIGSVAWKALLWTLFGGSWLLGAMVDNPAPQLVWVAWISLAMLAMIYDQVLNVLTESYSTEDRFGVYNRGFSYRGFKRSLFFFYLWVPVLLTSHFVFLRYDGFNVEEERYAVIEYSSNHREVINQPIQVAGFVPFVHTVRSYEDQYHRRTNEKLWHAKTDTQVTCAASTVDGSKIQATVWSDLTIRPQDVGMVDDKHQGEYPLIEHARELECKAFEVAAKTRRLEDFPKQLVLSEHDAGSDPKLMNEAGLHFSGVFGIEDVHALVRQ